MKKLFSIVITFVIAFSLIGITNKSYNVFATTIITNTQAKAYDGTFLKDGYGVFTDYRTILEGCAWFTYIVCDGLTNPSYTVPDSIGYHPVSYVSTWGYAVKLTDLPNTLYNAESELYPWTYSRVDISNGYWCHDSLSFVLNTDGDVVPDSVGRLSVLDNNTYTYTYVLVSYNYSVESYVLSRTEPLTCEIDSDYISNDIDINDYVGVKGGLLYNANVQQQQKWIVVHYNVVLTRTTLYIRNIPELYTFGDLYFDTSLPINQILELDLNYQTITKTFWGLFKSDPIAHEEIVVPTTTTNSTGHWQINDWGLFATRTWVEPEEYVQYNFEYGNYQVEGDSQIYHYKVSLSELTDYHYYYYDSLNINKILYEYEGVVYEGLNFIPVESPAQEGDDGETTFDEIAEKTSSFWDSIIATFKKIGAWFKNIFNWFHNTFGIVGDILYWIILLGIPLLVFIFLYKIKNNKKKNNFNNYQRKKKNYKK